MTIIKPTKEEVFNALRRNGCCWLGGHGCQCYSRSLKQCFNDEKNRMTKVVYTQEEIAQAQEENNRAMEDINKALDMLHEEE